MREEPAKIVVVGDTGVWEPLVAAMSDASADFVTRHNAISSRDSSMEFYYGVAQKNLKNKDLVIFVCDLTDADSITHINARIDEIKRDAPEIPIILVGNNSDQAKQQTRYSAQDIANTLRLTYIETSAKTGHNVGVLLQTAKMEALAAKQILAEEKAEALRLAEQQQRAKPQKPVVNQQSQNPRRPEPVPPEDYSLKPEPMPSRENINCLLVINKKDSNSLRAHRPEVTLTRGRGVKLLNTFRELTKTADTRETKNPYPDLVDFDTIHGKNSKKLSIRSSEKFFRQFSSPTETTEKCREFFDVIIVLMSEETKSARDLEFDLKRAGYLPQSPERKKLCFLVFMDEKIKTPGDITQFSEKNNIDYIEVNAPGDIGQLKILTKIAEQYNLHLQALEGTKFEPAHSVVSISQPDIQPSPISQPHARHVSAPVHIPQPDVRPITVPSVEQRAEKIGALLQKATQQPNNPEAPSPLQRLKNFFSRRKPAPASAPEPAPTPIHISPENINCLVYTDLNDRERELGNQLLDKFRKEPTKKLDSADIYGVLDNKKILSIHSSELFFSQFNVEDSAKKCREQIDVILIPMDNKTTKSLSGLERDLASMGYTPGQPSGKIKQCFLVCMEGTMLPKDIKDFAAQNKIQCVYIETKGEYGLSEILNKINGQYAPPISEADQQPGQLRPSS